MFRLTVTKNDVLYKDHWMIQNSKQTVPQAVCTCTFFNAALVMRVRYFQLYEIQLLICILTDICIL